MTEKRTKAKGPEKSGPARSIKFRMRPDVYTAVVESQCVFARETADKIELGECLTDMEAGVATAIIRLWADNISRTEPRKAGAPPKVDGGNVALEYEALVRVPSMKKLLAREQIGDRYGVSAETVRNAVKQYGDAAKALCDFLEAHAVVSYKKK